MENPIKMDDLGVPLFLETPIYEAHPTFCSGIQLAYIDRVHFAVGRLHKRHSGNRTLAMDDQNKTSWIIIDLF